MNILSYDFSIPHPSFADARHRLRKRASASVEISAPAFGRFSGWLIDLSVDGCRLHSAIDFAPDTHVTVSIAGGCPLPASVIWSHEGETGLRFGAIDHRAVVEQLLLVLAD